MAYTVLASDCILGLLDQIDTLKNQGWSKREDICGIDSPLCEDYTYVQEMVKEGLLTQ